MTLLRRLDIYAEGALKGCQCGLGRGKSTADHIISAKKNSTDTREDVHVLFVDFKQTYGCDAIINATVKTN